MCKSLSAQDSVAKFGVKVYQSGDKYVIEADKVFSEVKIFNTSSSLIDSIKSGRKILTIEKINWQQVLIFLALYLLMI